MGEMKSAFEIAMEKVARMGEATEEDKLRWEHISVGEKLASRYLEGKVSLMAEIGKYRGKEKEYVLEGFEGVLVAGIGMLKDDEVKRQNKKIMEGVKAIKNDKVAVENIFSRMRVLFEHDLEQGDKERENAYNSIKAGFERQLKQAAIQKYGKMAAENMEVYAESHPQFMDEVRRVIARIESGYISRLDSLKKALKDIK